MVGVEDKVVQVEKSEKKKLCLILSGLMKQCVLKNGNAANVKNYKDGCRKIIKSNSTGDFDNDVNFYLFS